MSNSKEEKIEEAKDSEKQNLNTIQLIVFRQGNEEYGIHIDQIKEVVLTPNITKMPQTPSFIKGVANIRGNIIGIVDLEEKFGIKEHMSTEEANSKSNYTLVVESEELKIGILVTEVPNTLSVSESKIENSISIINESNLDSDYISGIVKLDARLIIMIDIFKVLDEKEVISMTSESET